MLGQFGGLVSCFVVGTLFGADSLCAAVPALNEQLCICALGLIIGVLAFFLPLTGQMHVNSWSVAVHFINLAALVATFLQLSRAGSLASIMAGERFLVDGGRKIPHAMNTFLTAFSVHIEAPVIYHQMKDRHQWPRAVVLACCASAVFSIAVASIGYCTWGPSVSQNFIVNLGRDRDLQALQPQAANELLRTACGILSAYRIVVVLPLILKAIDTVMVEQVNMSKNLAIKAAWRITFMAAAGIFCVAFRHQMAYLLGLGSALLDSIFTSIVPTAAWLWLYWHQLSKVSRFFIWIILIASVAYMGLGSSWALSKILIPSWE